MKITNTGNNLIYIGSIPLMPGESVAVSNSTAESDYIQVLANNNEVKLTEETAKSAAKSNAKSKTSKDDTAKSETPVNRAKKAQKNSAKEK